MTMMQWPMDRLFFGYECWLHRIATIACFWMYNGAFTAYVSMSVFQFQQCLWYLSFAIFIDVIDAIYFDILPYSPFSIGIFTVFM